MRPILTMTLTLGIAATAAFAHVGVKDPQVMARMTGMKTMAGDLKTLGQMAKGVTPYDAEAANAALVALRSETDRISELFAPQASDPKSEAKSNIWTDTAGFTQRTTEMTAVLDATLTSSPADIAASMRAIGAACSACHEDYRIEK